jgi:hypothetical protein
MTEPLLGRNGNETQPNVPRSTVEGNEIRSLLGGDNIYIAVPLWLDDRRWVRWPAALFHIFCQSISSTEILCSLLERIKKPAGGNVMNILLLFLPPGIVSVAFAWPDKIVFTLNLIAVIPLDNLLNSVAEELWLGFGDRAATALRIILPHIFPLIVSLELFDSESQTNCV